MDHKILLTPPKSLYTKCIITIIYVVSISHLNAHFITSCKQTPYPSVCDHHMSNSPLKTLDDQTDGFTFHDLVVSSTMDQAVQLHRLVSSLKQHHSLHKHATSALFDCLELYEDTIDQLNHSRRSYGQYSSPHDRQTSLSAAIANQDTCRNGFRDFKLTSSYSKYFPVQFHRNLTKSISNSLAVTKAAAEAEAVAEKYPSTGFTKFSKQRSSAGGGSHRRLLLFSDEKFPSWFPLSDRKLLEDSKTTAKADLVVAKDGSGHYTSIQQAVNAAAKLPRRNQRLVIYVKAGVYRENVVIKKSIKNVMVIGDGIDSTIVTGNRNVQDGTTTFRSATFAVSGNGFIAQGITFENTAGPEKHQAVALRSSSDFSVFYACSFKGYQDTLYLHSSRQFLRNCNIYGTVDFIFGDATAILQNCNIYARKPMSGQKNTITAQSRKEPDETTGFVIQSSTVATASETYLGRPWRSHSRTVFMKCNLGALVSPAGWLPWSGSFALSTLYYGEYGNTGAGASVSGRVKWPGYHVIKTVTEAEKFTVENFLDGNYWITATGVPVNDGL
ncbi:F26F24.2 [Arabidopsis thaliana]|uniref:Probable pectinesterase/pectinesterase inhibitor 6 n=2 Tax=Arabidopsis thaliana TaxID=3702 RepID=PME6_ARATH|nr:Plant invertase/pectin methylesterase inhibitor superfamily [Arabidopsis thaliana]O49298.1 RecName: Full=Probable pectinesterase/pectinesterase inhibitor 6; Includes: RecName: Full=Pectinesterase inhibitor 6; AltName: Full=Pectin methylesterase inhibitor 6; Includes: RecName: Full=Pectinesterase 6; Short=PE 6; AltName: Full=Pectin methylesterase 6; Short=AtPME6; Flags: Precursor [Arabidopsis thaliana]AAC00600.1 putative pectinesterase [Arabidopsis thaliana]AAF86993.1 F26F24.2 [Arabidopsis tha|eukprot:NP_173733.1 Plant invertase/pectin methylesterase inhibitor superfamily [Arabidopsis thaliana]